MTTLINNKLSRAKAQKQSFIQTKDGTEVLHTKEARQKNRRWTFQADVKLIVAAHKNETGKDIPLRVLPERTMNLEAVSYGTAKQARADCVSHEQYLRTINPLFKDSILKIRAIPHETVSNETLKQLEGYRDMSVILDRALQLAIEEAQLVVEGKSVGAQFMCSPAQPAVGEPNTVGYTPAHPERSTLSVKEEFYKRALDLIKPKEQVNASAGEEGRGSDENTGGLEDGNDNGNTIIGGPPVSQVVLTDASTETEDEHRSFEPEIINIQRSGESQG